MTPVFSVPEIPNSYAYLEVNRLFKNRYLHDEALGMIGTAILARTTSRHSQVCARPQTPAS